MVEQFKDNKALSWKWQCGDCAHREPEEEHCKAFPDGIPRDVGFDILHTTILEGQVGDYVYTPRVIAE